ncbi:hypothetical protein [Rhizobium sp. NPDC090279]|uniref:hypothetical protein n=1 Tax=Rhizobium sp. NPDC090279 TaxID=3364499 RepID=UPI00383AFEC3
MEISVVTVGTLIFPDAVSGKTENVELAKPVMNRIRLKVAIRMSPWLAAAAIAPRICARLA